MTEREIQGKWFQLRKSGVFEITEFELAGSYCAAEVTPKTIFHGNQRKQILKFGKIVQTQAKFH